MLNIQVYTPQEEPLVMTVAQASPLDTLKRIFGYPAFRPLQAEIIDGL
jgi:superfamily II DNA helicase RecQ